MTAMQIPQRMFKAHSLNITKVTIWTEIVKRLCKLKYMEKEKTAAHSFVLIIYIASLSTQMNYEEKKICESLAAQDPQIIRKITKRAVYLYLLVGH